jgi:hypothetical protein
MMKIPLPRSKMSGRSLFSRFKSLKPSNTASFE